MPSPLRRALRRLLPALGVPPARPAAGPPRGLVLRAAERLVGLLIPKNASGNNASVR
jgi:hypothetical protein